ncbi:hypothetical protein ACJJTC_019165 [Scirpophaga incertulas]
MSAQKSPPLTKEEVMMLVELIESHPMLFSKATNASNNQLKEATWTKLTSSFNSMIASNPRKPEQLRLKWENLKKAAMKRSTKKRMNNLKTGGGKPDFIPPDEALDKVASILGSTCDGYSVPFGGDAEIEVVDSTAEKSVEEQNIVIVPFDDGVDPLPPVPAQPALSPLHTPPPPKKFFFSAANSKAARGKSLVGQDEPRPRQTHALPRPSVPRSEPYVVGFCPCSKAPQYVCRAHSRREYRRLWDAQCPDYTNRGLREDAWRKISQEMTLPIAELKKKMDSLLGSYRREKSREKKAESQDQVVVKYIFRIGMPMKPSIFWEIEITQEIHKIL